MCFAEMSELLRNSIEYVHPEVTKVWQTSMSTIKQVYKYSIQY